jgi:hypothetical protein
LNAVPFDTTRCAIADARARSRTKEIDSENQRNLNPKGLDLIERTQKAPANGRGCREEEIYVSW